MPFHFKLKVPVIQFDGLIICSKFDPSFIFDDQTGEIVRRNYPEIFVKNLLKIQ